MSPPREKYIDVDLNTRRRMQAVKQFDTKPEMIVRAALRRLGIHYRLHKRDLPGKPDIVMASRRSVIFVHGCFWHGHESCRRASIPVKNAASWAQKVTGNHLRDERNVGALRGGGWRVLVLWECGVRDDEKLRRSLEEFLKTIC